MLNMAKGNALLLKPSWTPFLKIGVFLLKTNSMFHVLSVFLDLSKAFDTIDHILLLEKLHFYGFSSSACSMIKDYLTNRHAIVRYEHKTSKKEPLNVGVPQGSILGPFLFIIFMNDMCHLTLHSKLHLYADDTTISYAHKDIITALRHLEEDLVKIAEWLEHNRLIVNWSKTNAMHFNHSRKFNTASDDLQLECNGNKIEFVDQTRLLGVIIDNKLTFTGHITSVCKQINSKTNLLNRCKYLFETNIMAILIKIFIQSKLDYC